MGLQKFNQTSLLSQQEFGFWWSCIKPLLHPNFHNITILLQKMIKYRQKSKYNKYWEPAKSKKLMQVCLKEKCIVLERLRVIAGDIWGKFLPLGYKIMVFVMSHYFNVEKKKEITFVNFVIFVCVCVWWKISLQFHEKLTKQNSIKYHHIIWRLKYKKIKADILVKHAILINKDRFANIFMKDDCILFLLVYINK